VRGWHQKDEAPRPLPPKRPLKAKENVLRFVPLGGMEEIGRNCSFFEYNDEIVVIDVGIQFPEEFTPGIDYIIPDATYLESVKHKVKGIVLTHGHYDHIAAIHYLLEKLGNPIVYTSRFTGAMVQKRHEEFTNAPKMKLQTVQPGDRVRLSEHLTIEFFAVEHTVPEAYGFILETPAGNMASFGDFRLDIGKDGKPQNMQAFEMLRSRNIHTLLMDSTNADSPGHGSSEDTVIENLEILVRNAKGRIIIACFASLVDRILEIIDIAERVGRKVALNGRSMKGNLDIAKSLGYLKEKKDVMIPLEDISKYPDSKLLILTTGSQGESNAGLMRIVNGEHRVVRLKENDTVVFSSSVIPGNERSIQTLQDNISRQVDELYNSKLLDIHASGHAHGADVELVISVVKPKFVVPIHGYYFKRKSYIKHAIAAGLKRSQVILMDNGQIAELTPDTFTVTKDSVPSTRIMVDGLGIGDVEEVVLRDRMNLSQEGMIVVILTMDRNHSKMLRNPDIISRGFIHLKDNNMVLDEIRKRVTGLIARLPQDRETESDYIKSLVRDQVGQFVYNKTKRRPMVLPVVIEL
jgi:beta-CASP RNase J family ribonuclease